MNPSVLPSRPDHGAPEPVLLILADISGYTRFMTSNAKSLAHSQVIITELVQTIIQVVELPLTVAKLEGDAVFLYGRKRDPGLPWAEAKRRISERLPVFFDVFARRVNELRGSTTCTCGACANIEHLRLKFVVHSGEALFCRVAGFLELAGPDVILAHRLLKNSVPVRQYILLTDAALADLEMPADLQHTMGVEHYEDFPAVTTHVYADARTPVRSPVRRGVAAAIKWNLRLWFEPLLRFLFPELSGRSSGGGARVSGAGFVILSILLTPIYVPVCVLFTVVSQAARR
ncbi:MAG TPA: hypothetical protein DCY13_14540 [Verrucomicrobiales bacterium]|nr:hypothetical protein [Verrucomicrobiales bacterium]